MKSSKLVTVSGLIAFAVGLITGYFHFGPVGSFLLWGVGAIVVGFFVETKKEIWISGLSFGIILTFSFMLSAFGGTLDKLPGYLILTLGISVAGIIGSTTTIAVASFIKRKFFKKIYENITDKTT